MDGIFVPLVTPFAADGSVDLAALRALGIRHALPFLFIGNVGEEGEGDLRGMRHIFSQPRWKDAIHYSLVLDGARVVEVGSHEALMARAGQYAELYGIQAAAYR